MAATQTRRPGASHSPIDPGQSSPSPSDYASTHTVLSPEPDTSDIDESALVDGSVDEEEELYSDRSSSLEIPNESIDFDVVYSLRHFVATIEGQASVSKGDAMCLMDDSNSYWWLVKVLRSEDIGYIPAENIETPIERLARLNKHRNVDLAAATQAERDAHPALSALAARRARDLQSSSANSSRRGTPPNIPNTNRANSSNSKARVIFSTNFVIHNYPPAVWDTPLGEEHDSGSEEGDWEQEGMEVEDSTGELEPEGARDQEMEVDTEGMDAHANGVGLTSWEDELEPDDGIPWSGEALAGAAAGQQVQGQGHQHHPAIRGPTPPGTAHHLNNSNVNNSPSGNSTPSPQQQKAARQAQLGNGLASTLRAQSGTSQQEPEQKTQVQAPAQPRERLLSDPSPAPSVYSLSAESGVVDPAYALGQQILAGASQARQEQTQPQVTPLRPARQSTPGLGISAPAAGGQAASSSQPARPSQIMQAAQERAVQRQLSASAPPSTVAGSGSGSDRERERETRQRQGSTVSLTRTGSDGSGSASLASRGSGLVTSPALSESEIVGPAGSKRARQAEQGPRKLRKQTSEDFKDPQREKEKVEKVEKDDGKKKGGLLSGLFGRKNKESKEKEKLERERVEREERERQRLQIEQRDRDRQGQGQGQQRQGEHAREASEESQASFVSPPPASLLQQAAQPQQGAKRSNSVNRTGQEASPGTPSLVSLSSAATSPAPSTQASSRVQQLDKEQQDRYAQYLAATVKSSSMPAGGTGFATQSAAAMAQNGAATRLQHAQALAASGSPGPQKPSRPGSLILMNGILPPDGVPPELSVLRVFAGEDIANLTEATFKTVLLGPNTSSRDLIRQAVQRFHLPEDDTDPSPLDHPGAEGELHGEYYLTVKQADGGQEAVLMPDEKPLAVFEELSAAGAPLPPSVSKRASFGSINSMVSNLSAMTAIARLPMSDFTDDSRVKFYLQRRKRITEQDGVPTLSGKGLTMDSSMVRDESGIISTSSSGLMSEDLMQNNSLETSFSFSSNSTVGPRRLSSDRFSASSARFALQTVIHPSDLPDGMVFDPHTEAIVPRSALLNRSGTASASASPGISQTQRKKVFIFARNATVAEVIETSLDRFGIAEGVVDGGDDVEDRMVKRRSVTRVRYGLSVEIDGEERLLHPSSKIIDAFPRQPAFRVQDFRRTSESKRRSIDEPSVLGTLEDIQADDPIFVLRRAPGNSAMRNSGSSRHSRHSVPLDDVALAKLHAERRASASMLSMSSDRGSNVTDPDSAALSRQEIIREQRAQSRARQHGLLSAQTSDQGTNLVLPDRSQLRSTKSSSSSKVRYSYIHPDGEMYDISDIIEDELGTSENDTIRLSAAMDVGSLSGTEDLLEEVLATASQGRDARSGVEQRLERVLNRVQEKRQSASLALPNLGQTHRSSGASAGSFYSDDPRRSPRLDTSFVDIEDPHQRSQSQRYQAPASPPSPTIPSSPISGRTSTPSPKPAGPRHPHPTHSRQQPSIASVLSDLSMYDGGSSTPGSPRSPASMPSPSMPLTTTPTTMTSSSQTSSSTAATSAGVHAASRKPLVIKSDFAGLSRMMALIQLRGDMERPPKRKEEPEVDRMMFGPRMDLETLHPSVRDLFEPHFKQMEEYDQRLDRLLMSTVRAH
ncbi:hypothetical protein DACRYDRAFT_112789 [Dacryopinax primogenitus]|uniref:SH3 domain-containing protein n=1 Tax=Dacryopinax primogenitus (strain DJM 731) TaxID=1858805 RepID=M5GBY8_DACPD|nr:uncharacterized protein DACRYDRAFT_112789 [Dacryopinax primogenitus]EJU05975.1 hypothetical protein DACRYDRAFT_112789 [Dacryopinax primogenitus]